MPTIYTSPTAWSADYDPPAPARNRGGLWRRLHVRQVALPRAFRAPDPAGRTEQRGRPDHAGPRLHGRRIALGAYRRPCVRRGLAPAARSFGRFGSPPRPQPRACATDGVYLRRTHPHRLRDGHPPWRRRPRPSTAHRRFKPSAGSAAPRSLDHRPRPAAGRPRRTLPLPPGWRRAPAALRRRKTTGTERLLLGGVAFQHVSKDSRTPRLTG